MDEVDMYSSKCRSLHQNLHLNTNKCMSLGQKSAWDTKWTMNEVPVKSLNRAYEESI